MKISVIEVTKENMMDVVVDNSVYLIKKDWAREGYKMIHILESNVDDILSKKNLVVRIEK